MSPFRCDICDEPTNNAEDDYGEHVCNACLENRNERAYERLCEDYHDGDSTSFKSLRDQQIEALKLK